MSDISSRDPLINRPAPQGPVAPVAKTAPVTDGGAAMPTDGMDPDRLAALRASRGNANSTQGPRKGPACFDEGDNAAMGRPAPRWARSEGNPWDRVGNDPGASQGVRPEGRWTRGSELHRLPRPEGGASGESAEAQLMGRDFNFAPFEGTSGASTAGRWARPAEDDDAIDGGRPGIPWQDNLTPSPEGNEGANGDDMRPGSWGSDDDMGPSMGRDLDRGPDDMGPPRGPWGPDDMDPGQGRWSSEDRGSMRGPDDQGPPPRRGQWSPDDFGPMRGPDDQGPPPRRGQWNPDDMGQSPRRGQWNPDDMGAPPRRGAVPPSNDDFGPKLGRRGPDRGEMDQPGRTWRRPDFAANGPEGFQKPHFKGPPPMARLERKGPPGPDLKDPAGPQATPIVGRPVAPMPGAPVAVPVTDEPVLDRLSANNGAPPAANNAAAPAAQPVAPAAQPAVNAAQPAVNAAQPAVNAAQPAINVAHPAAVSDVMSILAQGQPPASP